MLRGKSLDFFYTLWLSAALFCLVSVFFLSFYSIFLIASGAFTPCQFQKKKGRVNNENMKATMKGWRPVLKVEPIEPFFGSRRRLLTASTVPLFPFHCV